MGRVLADLTAQAAPAPSSLPRLDRQPLRPTACEVVAHAAPGRDPLTGQRGGGEGLHLVGRATGLLVDCQVRLEPRGPALRGQLLPEGDAAPDLLGALVHVRTARGTVLASVDAHLEFHAPSLPDGRLRAVVVELADRVLELAVPAEEGEPS